MASIITELKRRNVLGVAFGYLALGWLLISIGDVFLPLMQAPDWALKALVMVTAFGLPIVVIFAWLFQITPDGIRRQAELDDSSAIDSDPDKKLNLAVIGVLVAALSVSVLLNIFGKPPADTDEGYVNGKQSIAVLPFSDRSTNPENALFVDGIHDDLLTNLARIRALKVISRTSVMEYRDTTKNIRDIARELGVSTVLEGAVQRSGDNVRINVQLIDAATDTHLWASSFDRELTARNIFEIQNEIARSISQALKAALTPTEQQRLDGIPTSNMAAYNVYRSARHNLEERQLDTAILARSQFEEAIALDPNYSEAYSGLADSILLLYINHAAVPRDEAYVMAKESLNTALELDPESADAYASLGLLNLDIWQQTRTGPRLEEAEFAFQKALELNPNHARAVMWYASLKASEENLDEAIRLYQRSLELDPLARIPYANLPGMYAAMGRNQKALEEWLNAVRLHPRWPTPYQNIAKHLGGLGRYDEAIAWNVKAMELDENPLAGTAAMGSYLVLGEKERALALLEQVPEDHPFAPLYLFMQHFANNEYAQMIAEVERVSAEGITLPPFVFDMASDTALLVGDLDAALKYMLKLRPDLLEAAKDGVDPHDVRFVVKLAYIAQRNGDHEFADELLAVALESLDQHPRLGAAGYGIRDVQILALMNKPEEALAKLSEAIEAGFRSSRNYDLWTLPNDPYLTSINSDPRFEEMYQTIRADISVMRQRMLDAEQSGDWDYLRSLASANPVNPAAITSL